MKQHYTYLLIIAMIIVSCGSSDSSISKGANGEPTFTYIPLNWQVTTPAQWYIMNDNELRQKTYASQQFYEYKKEDADANKMIFGLNKTEGKQANSLYAFISSNVTNHKAALKGILNQQYEQYTAPLRGYDDYIVDSTFRRKNIGGKEFYIATLKVAAPKGGGYYEYITYSTMVDSLNFGASIISNNVQDKKLLQQLWQASIATLKP